jgi:hypothetical protein
MNGWPTSFAYCRVVESWSFAIEEDAIGRVSRALAGRDHRARRREASLWSTPDPPQTLRPLTVASGLDLALWEDGGACQKCFAFWIN